MKHLYFKSLLIRYFFYSFILVAQFTNYAKAQAPTSLTYPTPVVYSANVSSIFLSPSVSGSVDSYSLTGDLPAGVSFNSNTGVISGKPTVAKATTVYTVTATNSMGSTSTNFTMTVYNSFLDNSNQQVKFGGSGVTISNPNGGNGQTAGDITLYRNIATLSGQAIDCIITTKSVNNVTGWTAYDQPDASGTNFSSNAPEFFAPQVTFGSGGGSISYDFQFIFSGTYNTATKKGDNVVLQNVTLNTYDIDGNGTNLSNQFNEFGGFNSSELGSSSPTVAATYNPATDLTRFRSTIRTNSPVVTAPATRVRVKYTNLSDFSIVVGSGANGLAFFFLDFSVGPTFLSTVTTTPSVDLDTQSPGVLNNESACGSSLFFTKRGQTNVSASGTLSQLDITYPSAMIKNGTNERLLINGSTAGTGTHALNFNTGSSGNVTVGGVQFVFTKSVETVVGEVFNKISFTRSSPTTFSVAEAEALLDAFQYDNNAPAPTFGDRRFVVNVLNPTFKSPNAAFTATVNCVSISGHIYHDANGLLGTTDAGTVNASGPSQFAENFAYAVLVDPATNQVVASQGIAAGGAYTFGRVTPGKYIVYVSDQPKTAGTEFTKAIFPAGGYLPTGENLGAQAGNDLLIDGKLTLTVGSVPVTNANFGLQVPPTANDVTAASQANPGGTQRVVVPTLNGNDLEDGILSGGIGNTVEILSLPDNATLYYNGVVVSLESPVISNYNPELLTIDPQDGALAAVFTYRKIDAAGFESEAATVNIPFTDFSIGGSVYYDINGATNSLIDGDLISNPNNVTLYANLVEKSTGLVKSFTTVTNGAYSFNTLNGLQSNTIFEIVISTVQGVPETATGTISSLPLGWANTAEGSGAGDSDADGILTVNVISTSINTGLDFGINQLPTAIATDPASQANPGGTVSVPVTSGFSGTDPNSGIIETLNISTFPTGATSITVGTTTYYPSAGVIPGTCPTASCSEFPTTGGVTVTTGDDGVPDQIISVDPASAGATSVAIPFTVTDNAGLVSEPATLNIPFEVLLLSGTVFLDVDGLTNSQVDGTASNFAETVFTNLVNPLTNEVIASVAVGGDGTYSFTVNANTNYSVILTNTLQTISAILTTATTPADHMFVGEGILPAGDGTPNGIITSIAVGASSISNVNFGIQQPPVSNNIINPASLNSDFTDTPPTGFSPVTGYLSIPYASLLPLAGLDPEDGSLAPGTKTVSIGTINANTLLYYDFGAGNGGVLPVAANTMIANFDPSKLVFFGEVGSGSDGSAFGFSYALSDAAGVYSAPASYVFSTSSPLPVTLTSFTAKKEGLTARLDWETTSETNSQNFEVQHSTDARTWNVISIVDARSESKELATYSFVHASPINGENLYRLKMVDRDGTFAYSKINSLNFAVALKATLYPNPALDKIKFNLEGSVVGDVASVKIFAMDGKMAYWVDKMENNEIDVKNLPAGAYVVTITLKDGTTQNAKIVIVK